MCFRICIILQVWARGSSGFLTGRTEWKRQKQLWVSIPLKTIETPLIVRLPFSAYTSVKVKNTVALCFRIVATNLLPAGWVLAESNIHLDSNSSPLPLVLFYNILLYIFLYYYIYIYLYPTEAILQRHRQRYKLDIVHTVRYKSLWCLI